MVKNKIFLFIMIILISLFYACTPKINNTQKDRLIIATYGDPHGLNPFLNDNRMWGRIAYCVFEGLLGRDDKGNIIPRLAETWEETEEGIRFNLVRGVQFHDDTYLTPEVVVWNIQMWGNSPAVTTGMDWIRFEQAHVINEYSVFLPTDYKSYLTLTNLASRNMFIISKTAYENNSAGFNLKPIGTGPFVLSEWIQDHNINLKKFDKYWGGQTTHLKEIVFRVIPEFTQQLIELETGNVDVILDIPIVSYNEMINNNSISIWDFPKATSDLLWFNCQAEHFSNPLVRQAVAYALNIREIWLGTYFGIGEPGFTVVPIGIYGVSEEWSKENWPYGWDTSNIDKSNELMLKAGYSNGIDVELTVDTDINRLNAATIIANQLNKVNIRTTIRSFDSATVATYTMYGNHQMTLDGSNANNGSIDAAFSSRFISASAIVGSLSRCKWSNKEFDTLVVAAAKSHDDLERIELYKQAQKIIVDEVPAIPYNDRLLVVASSNRVKGLYVNGEFIVFASAYIE